MRNTDETTLETSPITSAVTPSITTAVTRAVTTDELTSAQLSDELRDYALDLLAGTGIDLDTVLNFPLGPIPPTAADDATDADDLTAVLWAGWSATARHNPSGDPTQPELPGLNAEDTAPGIEPRTNPTAGGHQ